MGDQRTEELRAALLHYLTGVLRTSPAARSGNAVPTSTETVDSALLADLVTDPASLTDFEEKDPAGVIPDIIRAVLWLERVNRAVIPAELDSRIARLRFLVWSLPARLDGVGLDSDLFPDTSVYQSGKGEEITISLNPRRDIPLFARQAREEWTGFLRAWQDDPWLSTRHATDPAWFDRELRRITESWPDRVPRLPGGRLDLLPGEGQDRDDDRLRVGADLAEAHWLPRGSLFGAARAIGAPRWGRALMILWFAMFALAPVLLLSGRSEAARWTAAGVIALGLAVVVCLPPRRDLLLLLRIPAAAGAGAVVLLTLTPRWWADTGGPWLGLGLLGLAAAYLVLETRLHGVDILRAVGRGMMIGIIAALMSATVSIAVIGFVAPRIAEHGECLVGWWRDDPYQELVFPPADRKRCVEELGRPVAGKPVDTVTVMTGLALGVGLAAQILWDDRPVTAPLGRLRRVRGGTS